MERLDVLLMRQSDLSRNLSQSIIRKGLVKVDGATVRKCGAKFEPYVKITYEPPKTLYVSRGGYKLEEAIRKFNIDLEDKVCVDVGASTGGFTDCMLQNGAKMVYAIDTGSDQLSKKLKENAKVVNFENTNISGICDEIGKYGIDFVSVDVSFVSQTKIAHCIKILCKSNTQLVTLIKPQFEAGRQHLNKNGIVRNKKMHTKVIDEVTNCFVDLGFCLKGIRPSPITGTCGNEEYLAHYIYRGAQL